MLASSVTAILKRFWARHQSEFGEHFATQASKNMKKILIASSFSIFLTLRDPYLKNHWSMSMTTVQIVTNECLRRHNFFPVQL